MNAPQGLLPSFRSILNLVVSLLVAIACGAILDGEASASATGSVTARVYLCPDNISLIAVQNWPPPSPLLGECDPFDSGMSFPQLRALPGGTPTAGDDFAPGVLLWPRLPLGDYDFGGGNAPSGFGGLLITTGGDIPVDDQERAPVTITSAKPHIERRFYFFTPQSANVGSIVVTLYHCPSDDDLSTAACTLVTDSPHVAGIFQDGWPEPALSGFEQGQASWHGIPLGEYTLGYGGLPGIGETAAIPEIGCVSPDGCQVTLDSAGEIADLELFVYPLT